MLKQNTRSITRNDSFDLTRSLDYCKRSFSGIVKKQESHTMRSTVLKAKLEDLRCRERDGLQVARFDYEGNLEGKEYCLRMIGMNICRD